MSVSTDVHARLVVARSGRDLLNGGPPDAILPGFFIRVFRNEGYDDLLGEGDQADRQVTLEQALAIADAFDAAAGLGPRTRNAILSAAGELVRHIDAQVARAEAAIEALPKLQAQAERLRQTRADFELPPGEVWFRVADLNGLTLRWVTALDEEDARRKWVTTSGAPSKFEIHGPYATPVIGP